MQEQRDKPHSILRKAFDDAGIADGFYCGVLMDGTDISAFNVGREDKAEYSNVERYQRLLGVVADDFLGSQGDIWDAQKDMFLALCGATLAVLLLARRQDRQLRDMAAWR